MSSITLRQYKEGDEINILKLDAEIRKDSKIDTEDKWNWEFIKNPQGKSIIYVYETENKIVGNYNLIPITFNYKNHEIHTMRAVYAMMHPKYGVYYNRFSNMVKEAFITAHKENYNFVWTIANEKSILPQTKIGYNHIGNYKTIFKILDIQNFSRNYILKNINNKFVSYLIKFLILVAFYVYRKLTDLGINKTHSKYKIHEISRFDINFDKFWSKVKYQYGITLVRSSRYLNWRFVDNPHNKNKIFSIEDENNILGYVVLGIYESKNIKFGVINDIIFDRYNKKCLIFLINKAIKYFYEKKVVGILSLVIDNSIENKNFLWQFRRKGFVFTHKNLTGPILMYSGSEGAIDKDIVEDIRHWYMTFAFTEGIRF